MVIELRVVQFWPEIILVISNRTHAARSFDFDFRPNCTPLSSILLDRYVIQGSREIARPASSLLHRRTGRGSSGGGGAVAPLDTENVEIFRAKRR